MREVKSVTIDGYVYSVQQLGAKLGKKVLAHIMRVIGPAFEATDPVAKFASTFTDDEFDYLCDTFVATTQFSAEDSPDKVLLLKDHFDSHFANRYGAMMKWLWACVETNFGTFLGELGLTPEARANLLEAAKAEMLSPKMASTSPSGVASSTDAAASGK